MSRDFTPRDLYLVEQMNIKEGNGSLWDFMKNTSIHYKGQSFPLRSEKELQTRMNYPMLGKLLDCFEKLYAELSKIPGGLEFLEVCDKELTSYIESGKGNEDSPVIKWFLGKLDENFYYHERNDGLLLEFMQEEAMRKSKTKESLTEQIETASKEISGSSNEGKEVSFER